MNLMKIKNLFIVLFFVNISYSSLAQKSVDVTIRFVYKGKPLCNWDVTLKHGDVGIGQAKTNDDGVAQFSSVSLLSLSVDAYGYKKLQNGDKKWDVKGYIQLDNSYKTTFDFEKLVNEMGMPGMMEAAWGLTLNDCGVMSKPTKEELKPEDKTSSQSSPTEKKSGDETKSTLNETKSTMDEFKQMQQERSENLAEMKAGLNQKLVQLEAKKEKKSSKRAGLDPSSVEYSDLSYELAEIDLEIEETNLKIQKADKQIERGNLPLKKEDRAYFDVQEERIKENLKKLKSDKK